MMSTKVGFGLLALAAVASAADKSLLSVKIVDRRDSATDYSYTIPSKFYANSTSTVNCGADFIGVNCYGGSTTTASAIGPRTIAYQVSGATLTLQMADGRIVVANCQSKYQLRFDYINRRSCRTPLVDDIEADFNGNNAKLIWPVSIDGKKVESETYKILGIFGGRQNQAAGASTEPAPVVQPPVAPSPVAAPTPSATPPSLFDVTFTSTPPNALVTISRQPIGRTPFITRHTPGI